MAKKRVGRYPKAFKQMAVEPLKRCENIVALSQELGCPRRLLYTLRDQLDPVERSEGLPANARESTLRKEVSQLKRLLPDKTLEVDFSKGPCTPSRRDASGAACLARYREIAHGQILGDNSDLFEMLFNRPTDSSSKGTEAFAQAPKLSQLARSELTIRYVSLFCPPY